MILFHIFQWCNIKSIVHPQHSLKHGVCPKLGALGKYFQFISMNKSIANWNYLFAGIEKDLSNNPHQLPAKVILIQRIGFSKKKKIIMNKSSSLLLHLTLHLLHFLIMNKSSYFEKKKKKSSSWIILHHLYSNFIFIFFTFW